MRQWPEVTVNVTEVTVALVTVNVARLTVNATEVMVKVTVAGGCDRGGSGDGESDGGGR